MTLKTFDSNGDNFSLSALPKTALQAIYHALTGKIENLTRVLTGNVIISDNDIDVITHPLAKASPV